ncbi:heat shock 70 kDa protein 12A-like [Mya arenaria]|uniref:heat shock 70 kDa protein 12A-like n=1 Tax=Mya arenaria TaxID=6604 RepID=UPI0022E10BC2|nr:heat shock 70 kDa protein 12A-like [Mya arenaria]
MRKRRRYMIFGQLHQGQHLLLDHEMSPNLAVGMKQHLILEFRHQQTVYTRKKESAIVCAAIDFGTTNTGYAYSFKAKPRDIITNYWYGREIKPLDKDMKIENILDKRMKAIDIFTVAIRYIKDHLMKELTDSHRMKEIKNKSESDIHWLLTVPAIWDDLSKRFMRTATNNAGIPDEMLSLALEPEDASVFCKDELGMMTIPVGCRYMVLNLGGGTGDITVHEVNPDESLKELHLWSSSLDSTICRTTGN